MNDLERFVVGGHLVPESALGVRPLRSRLSNSVGDLCLRQVGIQAGPKLRL